MVFFTSDLHLGHNNIIRFCNRPFSSVEEMSFLSVNGNRIQLCHYPMLEWDDSRHGSYLIFGHIHNKTESPIWDIIKNNDHMLNAGVDINGFYPVTFNELVENNRIFKELHS